MPPRKSLEAKPSAAKGAEDDTPSRSTTKAKDGLGIEDLTLPRTMIQRLAKGVLPANTQIQKDALLAIHKSATVFVSYLADSANDRAILANKKTIQPKDVLEALAELEFEAFLPRCEAELNLFNNIQCTKRNDYRRRVKVEREAASQSALLAAADTSHTGDGSETNGLASRPRTNGIAIRDRDSSPAAKKARMFLAMAANGEFGEGSDDDMVYSDDEDEEDEEGSEEDVDTDDAEDPTDAGQEGEDGLDVDREGKYGPEEDEDEELRGSESE